MLIEDNDDDDDDDVSSFVQFRRRLVVATDTNDSLLGATIRRRMFKTKLFFYVFVFALLF